MTGSRLSLPTTKWFATQTTAIAALLIAFVNAGDWNKTLSIALIGLLSQAVIGYLIPNSDTPGGVAVRADASKKPSRAKALAH